MGGQAIRVEGAKEVRQRMKKMGADVGDIKQANYWAAQEVLETARGYMPSVSGDLKASYYAKGLQTRGVVGSRLPRSGVSEFGGSIPNRGKKGSEGFRHKKKPLGISLQTRAKGAGRHVHKLPASVATEHGSYYIYPALEDRRQDIYVHYTKEMQDIANKNGLGG